MNSPLPAFPGDSCFSAELVFTIVTFNPCGNVLSFTGLKTAISASFYVGVEDKSVPLLEREMKNLNFQ